jgi:hypothetical protein
MKKLIVSIAILVGLSVSAQAETDYREWTRFIEKTWDCKEEIKQAGRFTGCSGFSLDYMHLMEDPNAQVNWDEAPTEYQTEIARIMGIDPENPEQDPADVMRVLDGVMVVMLDFMCHSPEGKAWIVSEMVAGQQDQTSIAGSLIGLSVMNSIFCNLPVDTNFGALLENL